MRIVLTSGEGPVGAFIRWYTWSWAAHAAIQLDDGTIIDATLANGVSHHQRVMGKEQRFYDIVLPPEANMKNATQWLYAQLGKPYDWTAITGMAFRRDWHDPKSWFCSELVEAFSEAGHFPLIEITTDNLDRVSPRDLTLSTRLKLSHVIHTA